MINDTFFGAFIMTYKRVTILEESLKKIFNQSFPPQKVLIIDNDPDFSASEIIHKFPGFNISYHAIGYNSGPAGAANVGLKILSNEGYKWIAWMDDDDPPIFDDTFEILLSIAKKSEKCGCVGTVGQYFNKRIGRMVRVPNSELDKTGVLQVDNIAGGMCKIVNAQVCLIGNVYPDTSLFYGFEELDFDLRLQKAGYILLTDRKLYKKHRVYFNRIKIHKTRNKKKDGSKLWREFYSTRNTLIILKKNIFLSALCFSFFRYTTKIVFGFKYGYLYGSLNAKFIAKGILYFLLGKRGQYN